LTTQKKPDMIVSKINVILAKYLAYKTPVEVFAKCGGVALVGFKGGDL
jgi:hypothetical protein